MDIQLPTVISTAAISNAIVRGAEHAVRELGPGYFTVIFKEIVRPSLRVYRSASQAPAEALAVDQQVAPPDTPIWSASLTDLDSKELSELFGKGWLRHFFLSEEEALSYIESIESKVVAHLTAEKVKNNG